MAPTQVASSPRFLLRDMTAADHARAEAVHYRDQKFADQAGYFGYLACLYRAHSELGSAAAGMRGDAREGAHHDRSAALICADLGRVPVSDTVPGPGPARLSAAQSWGVSYALIGSALGATTVLRALQGDVNWPLGYLQATAAFATSNGVARFFAALNAAAPEPEQAASGARLVFDVIANRQHLAEP